MEGDGHNWKILVAVRFFGGLYIQDFLPLVDISYIKTFYLPGCITILREDLRFLIASSYCVMLAIAGITNVGVCS